MSVTLPRIIGPNLGCPIIASPEDVRSGGIQVLLAEPAGENGSFSLVARPSFGGEGHEFMLNLTKMMEVKDSCLPAKFGDVDETRLLISTTLRSAVLPDKARIFQYNAIPNVPLRENCLRSGSEHKWLPTLYDLSLQDTRQPQHVFHTVHHALCLRQERKELTFVHLTDLHVSLRNDLFKAALMEGPARDQESLFQKLRSFFGSTEAADGKETYIDFNDNLRRFISHANSLADKEGLDFVLMSGDLVDFSEHGITDTRKHNNWRTFQDIVLGSETKGAGSDRTSPGLKVPLFSSTGNHDWRHFPYSVSVIASAFGLKKRAAKGVLDQFWADEQGEVSVAHKKFFDHMIAEGSLISNVMLGGKYLHWVGDALRKLRDWLRGPTPEGKVRGNLADWLLPRLQKWQVQTLAPLAAGAGSHWLPGTDALLKAAGVMAAVSVFINGIVGVAKFLVRWRAPDLMALEADWKALRDYFLFVNPYYNYAFRVGKNYFMLLDTGYDCLRAQRFWNNGRKKLGPISIKDNILGGSPDSMGFWAANEFYPYGQITWIQRLLEHIGEKEGTTNGGATVVIGLHAPPVNLSEGQRKKADRLLTSDPDGLLLDRQFNIRYGTINHYLSQFLHLCLGKVEDAGNSTSQEPEIRKVDMVLAGHAHWKFECSLRWDGTKPCVYYNKDFTPKQESLKVCTENSRSWILQTPPCGPRGDDSDSANPPYYRLIKVDAGRIKAASVKSDVPKQPP